MYRFYRYILYSDFSSTNPRGAMVQSYLRLGLQFKGDPLKIQNFTVHIGFDFFADR